MDQNEKMPEAWGPGRVTKLSRPRRSPPVVSTRRRTWKSKNPAPERPQSAEPPTMTSHSQVEISPRPKSALYHPLDNQESPRMEVESLSPIDSPGRLEMSMSDNRIKPEPETFDDDPGRTVNFTLEPKRKRKSRDVERRHEDGEVSTHGFTPRKTPKSSERSATSMSWSSSPSSGSGRASGKGFHEYRRQRQRANDVKMAHVEKDLRKYGTDVTSAMEMLKAYGYRRPIKMPKVRTRPNTPRYRRREKTTPPPPTRTYESYSEDEELDDK